jgi:hypothetical protein
MESTAGEPSSEPFIHEGIIVNQQNDHVAVHWSLHLLPGTVHGKDRARRSVAVC